MVEDSEVHGSEGQGSEVGSVRGMGKGSEAHM